MTIKGLNSSDYRYFDTNFPLDTVIGDVIISKKGEPTIGWELSLPVAYTQTEARYDRMVMSLMSAVRKLPPWYIVHKMDMFTTKVYDEPDTGDILQDSYTAHHRGGRYLEHRSYIFLTLSTKGQCMKGVRGSGLFKFIYRAGTPTKAQLRDFRSVAGTFIDVFTEAGASGIKPRLLTYEDYDRNGGGRGLIQKYLMLGDDSPLLTHPVLSKEKVVVGDRTMMCFNISESDQLPEEISTVQRVDALSTDKSEVYLSTGAQVGVLLDCDHIVNQYVMTMPQQYVKKDEGDKEKRMQSGFTNNANRLASEEIQEFLDALERDGIIAVRSHFNVLAWGPEKRLPVIRGQISTALSYMNTTAVYNVYDTPVHYYSGIPGAASEMGQQNWMYNHVGPAVAMCPLESYEVGMPGGAIRLSDRIRNIPVRLDISMVAYNLGLIPSYGVALIGPSGTGKSFLTNKILADKYSAGEHIFVIDIGDSYELHTQYVKEISGGKDGDYLTWDPEHPFSFNPFVDYTEWPDKGGFLQQDHSSVIFFLSFVRTLWSPDGGWDSPTNTILNQIIQDFVQEMLIKNRKMPVFHDFYRYVSSLVKRIKSPTAKSKYMCGDIEVTKDKFDIEKFVLALKDYSKDGPYHFLLNNPEPADLFQSRWTVFEIDKIAQKKDNKYDKFFSLAVLCIMHSFDIKMRGVQAFKTMVIEEAWSAIANDTMAPYVQTLYKTGRKFSCSPMIVTQQLSDLMASSVIKDTILQNSPVKILLDQSGNLNNFDEYQELLGFSDIQRNLCLSVNRGLPPGSLVKQVFISWGNDRFGVYTVAVSTFQALLFESNKQKKQPLLKLARERKSLIAAARELAQLIDKQKKIYEM